MKRMVDNAQTLNQVAKYTDVVENDNNATLQWEGNIEVNGSIHTKTKEIVEITIPVEGLELTPDTSKRYHIQEGTNNPEGINVNITLPRYVFVWNEGNMSIYEQGGKQDWINGCTDGWDTESANISILITNGTFVNLYIWFDEVNQVCYISAMNDI